jgi:hypothetical protein
MITVGVSIGVDWFNSSLVDGILDDILAKLVHCIDSKAINIICP